MQSIYPKKVITKCIGLNNKRMRAVLPLFVSNRVSAVSYDGCRGKRSACKAIPQKDIRLKQNNSAVVNNDDLYLPQHFLLLLKAEQLKQLLNFTVW